MFADTACLAITTERSCVDVEMREENGNCKTDRKLAKIMLTAASSQTWVLVRFHKDGLDDHIRLQIEAEINQTRSFTRV